MGVLFLTFAAMSYDGDGRHQPLASLEATAGEEIAVTKRGAGAYSNRMAIGRPWIWVQQPQ
jgi:hypothetical protein